MLDALPAALEAMTPDIAVVDQLMPAGGLVCAHLGVPFVSVANALPIDEEKLVPPYVVGWNYDPSVFGQWRNRGGWRIHDTLLRPIDGVIARRARAWGLPARRMRDCLSALAGIAQTVEGFDYPRATHLHMLGPFRLPPPGLPPEPGEVRKTPSRSGRTLGEGARTAFISFGSLQGYREDLFARIASACRSAGLHPVIAHGGRLSPQAQARLAGAGATVEIFVDQRAVLAEASLCVCHAGMNTVLDALAAGVPLVAVPLAYEQAAIAARIAWSGAGRRAGPARTDTLPRSIRSAIERPSYAEAARSIAGRIVQAGGAVRAAEIIETVARTRRPLPP